MSDDGKVIAKNVSVLMFSQFITWGLALLLMVFLPRYLGAENMGKLHLAGSLWVIVGMLVSFGMDTFIAKEIARDHEKTSELFGTTLVVRTFLYVFGFGGLALYSYLMDFPTDTIYVILIIGVANYFTQIGRACYAALQGLERMEYISLADIVSKFFNTFVSIILLFLGASVFLIAVVSIGTALIYSAVQMYYLNKMRPIRPKFSFSMANKLMRSSFPYFLTSISQTVYVTVDIVIIATIIRIEEIIGWYSVVDQLFGTLLFVPAVFVKAVFPALSRTFANDPNGLPKMMQRSFNLMLLISVPIGFGLLAVSTNLVTLLFGEEFINSGPILAIYGLVIIFTYQNTLLGQFLVSTDRPNSLTGIMVAASAIIFVLHSILIPWTQNVFGNGGIGGASAFVITECFIMVASLRLLPKGSLDRTNLYAAIKIFVAGVIMVGATWYFRDMFIAIPIIIGAVVYGALALLFRLIPKDDMDMFKGMVSDATHKLRQRRVRTAEVAGDN